MLTNQELIKFANGNTDFYEAAMAYFCDGEKSSENKGLMQTAFLAEVERKSGVSSNGLETNAWVNHPSVRWASMSIVESTIRAIIPATILPQFDAFCDFRTQGFGDVTKFDIMPHSFYVISKGGRSERVSFRQRKFVSEVTVAPEERIVTVYRKFYNVLAGKDNIADFLGLVILSVRTAMYDDALVALNTGLTTIPTGALSVAGAFDLKTLVKMCETVQYQNGGVRPVIAGSATALMNVVPDGTTGYRMNVDGEGDGRIGLVKNIMGYDVLKLDNAVTTAGALILPDNKIYVISPSQDKLVKGVLTASLSNQNEYYDNADLTSNYTTRQEWAFIYASSAKAGVYTIQ